MGTTASNILSSSCIQPNNTTDEQLKPNLTLFWLHVSSDENESIPMYILTQQDQVRSFIGNTELNIFNDELELDGYIREMPLMNKAVLIVNYIAATYAIPRVHHRCQVGLILVYDN